MLKLKGLADLNLNQRTESSINLQFLVLLISSYIQPVKTDISMTRKQPFPPSGFADAWLSGIPPVLLLGAPIWLSGVVLPGGSILGEVHVSRRLLHLGIIGFA